MATRVDFTKAVNKIQALGNLLKRPLRDVLDSGAKTVALRCAHSTQPFGTGADAKNAGDAAVSRDIQRIYGDAGGAWSAISNQRLRGAFWFHFKAGRYPKAEEIAASAGVEVGGFDGGARHRSERRTRRPLVLQKRPRYFIIRPRERQRLGQYVKQVQGDVGTAKGGWADVARALGSTPRGLRTPGDITANWITRNGHGYGSFTRGGSDDKPTIRIKNSIPWTRQALSESEEDRAKEIGHALMIKNLEIASKAEVRKLPRAA